MWHNSGYQIADFLFQSEYYYLLQFLHYPLFIVKLSQILFNLLKLKT